MDRTTKHGLERRCALTRAVLPTARLVRFVADPAGTIVPDLKRRLPGRGVWIEASLKSVEEAAKKGVFARSLKRPVTVPADLADQVADLLRRRALSALSLANKAGAVVAGFHKVAEALDAGHVGVLVTASDAAEDGAGKLARRAGTGFPATIAAFSSAELSLALGRSNVVHAAGLKSPAAEAFRVEVCRLSYYMTGFDGSDSRDDRPPAPAATLDDVAGPEAK